MLSIFSVRMGGNKMVSAWRLWGTQPIGSFDLFAPLQQKKAKTLPGFSENDHQGYNARKDEQLGMTQGKESLKDMSFKGRRDVARATRKPKGSFGFTHPRGK